MHSRKFKRPASALLAASAAVLVAASVGYSAARKQAPPIPAKLKQDIAAVAGLKSATARDAKLEQMAEAEGGQVSVYTSLSSLIVKSVQSAWAKDYPNIKLNLFRGSSEDVTAKTMAERKAHPDNGADIVESNGSTMLFFQHFKNALVPYTKSPYRANIPKKYRFDTFTADRVEKFVVAWNTNLVKGSDVPRRWQDLANPKWAGKLTMEPTDVDWFAALYTYLLGHGNNGKKMTPAAVNTLLSAIARNAQLINGHTAEATALAAGQVSIIVSGHAQSIEALQQKNAPVSFGPPFVSPVIERPQGVGITYWAPHPAAALLFYDWLLGPEAQQIMLAGGVVPADPHFQDSAFASHPPTVEVDLRPIVAHYDQWQKKYDSFTRLGH